MNEHVSSLQFLFHEIVELGEVFRDVFRLHIEQGVDNVMHVLIVGDVIQANCGRDD